MYESRTKRITIPMEKSVHVKIAAKLFQELANDFSKLYRSPNSEINKLFIAQMIISHAHSSFKQIANEEDGDKHNSIHYKNSR